MLILENTFLSDVPIAIGLRKEVAAVLYGKHVVRLSAIALKW
jgi:hypothetical protein